MPKSWGASLWFPGGSGTSAGRRPSSCSWRPWACSSPCNIEPDAPHGDACTPGRYPMIAMTNGVQIAFTDAGEGLPLVFIHGFPLSRGAWSRQVDAFMPKYRVIAPDLRGFGESRASAGPVFMSRYAEDIHALLLHLGTGPVILVGHSMGGYVALAFAKAFPDLL